MSPVRKDVSLWHPVMKPGPAARVIGHIRVSTSMQADRFSLPEQRRQIKDLCVREGWVLVGWCEEPGFSAKGDFDSRPEWKRLVQERAGVECEAIVSMEFSRWSRHQGSDYQSLEMLRRRGVWWQTVDGAITVNSDVTQGEDILVAVRRAEKAAYPRDLSMHVAKGKRGKAHAGYSNAPYPPYAYRYPADDFAHPGPHRVVYELDPDYLTAILALGGMAAQTPPLSAISIARALNEAGHRYRPSGPHTAEKLFTGDTVLDLLRRRYYWEYAPNCGHGTIVTPDGDEVEGRHKAVWSFDITQQIKANLERLSQAGASAQHSYHGNVSRHQYSGLLRCQHCNRTLIAGSNYVDRDHSAKRFVYMCASVREGLACPGTQRNAEERTTSNTRKTPASIREDVVNEQLGPLWERWAVLVNSQRNALRDAITAASDHDRTLGGQITHTIKGLNARRKRVQTLFEDGVISRDELKEKLAPIDQELAALSAAKDRAAAEPDPTDVLEIFDRLWDPQLSDIFEVRMGRREILRQLFPDGGIICDLSVGAIVGLRPHEWLLPVLTQVLQQDWTVEGDTLWANRTTIHLPSKHQQIQSIYTLLSQGVTSTRSIAEALHRKTLSSIAAILRMALERGLVTRKREPTADGIQFRYTLASTFDQWLEYEWKS